MGQIYLLPLFHDHDEGVLHHRARVRVPPGVLYDHINTRIGFLETRALFRRVADAQEEESLLSVKLRDLGHPGVGPVRRPFNGWHFF